MIKAIIAVPYLSGKGGTETVIKNFKEAFNQYDNTNISWKLISYGGTKYSLWMKKWDRKIYNFTNFKIIQYFCYIFFLPFLIARNLKKLTPEYFVATNPIIWTIAFYEKYFFQEIQK